MTTTTAIYPSVAAMRIAKWLKAYALENEGQVLHIAKGLRAGRELQQEGKSVIFILDGPEARGHFESRHSKGAVMCEAGPEEWATMLLPDAQHRGEVDLGGWYLEPYWSFAGNIYEW